MERGNALGMVLNRSRRGNALDRVEGHGLHRRRLREDGSEVGEAPGHPRPVVSDTTGNLLD